MRTMISHRSSEWRTPSGHGKWIRQQKIGSSAASSAMSAVNSSPSVICTKPRSSFVSLEIALALSEGVTGKLDSSGQSVRCFFTTPSSESPNVLRKSESASSRPSEATSFTVSSHLPSAAAICCRAAATVRVGSTAISRASPVIAILTLIAEGGLVVGVTGVNLCTIITCSSKVHAELKRSPSPSSEPFSSRIMIASGFSPSASLMHSFAWPTESMSARLTSIRSPSTILAVSSWSALLRKTPGLLPLFATGVRLPITITCSSLATVLKSRTSPNSVPSPSRSKMASGLSPSTSAMWSFT
mmetsp:Transcript_24516/g.47637  ORF Transcript_24516/g.47637 Transcript_24516/m.47637 type:complete len:300 (+) Transcript_24516:370-1269(+)